MKKSVSLLLALVLIVSAISITAFADNGGVKIKLNGEMKNLVAYNIRGNNYFKLRDIANLLKGTEAEFDVIWNESKQAIELLSNTPYSTNEALTSEVLKNPVARASYVPIYKDGATVLLGAYNIADNNYFKLRDVASAIDFGVDWNAQESIIEINTKKSYEYPTSSEFGLNTQYLSLLGKTKAEIDKMMGASTYSWEWGMSTYSGNVMIGWNSLGEEPADNSSAVSMYIPLGKLFFNCPSTVSKSQIKGLFTSSREEYNEMDGENVLTVNYCGKVLAFYPDYGLSSSSSAFINVMTNYDNPDIESVQIKNSTGTSDTPAKTNSAYYDYAVAHDSEFWSINQDWRDDREYYYLVDVDHDGQKEMVVKIGCGVGIYKEINGQVEQVFYDRLADSSGSVHYWVAKYDNKDYIIYTSASSSRYQVLYTLNNGRLNKVKSSMIVNVDYTINDNNVSESEYNKYINSIEYPSGISINSLK